MTTAACIAWLAAGSSAAEHRKQHAPDRPAGLQRADSNTLHQIAEGRPPRDAFDCRGETPTRCADLYSSEAPAAHGMLAASRT